MAGIAESMAEVLDYVWHRFRGRLTGLEDANSNTDLALHVLDEFSHHAAEIGLLRDLYANRATLRAG
jgi:hypothetical protein